MNNQNPRPYHRGFFYAHKLLLRNTKKYFTFAYMTRHERLIERNKKVRHLFDKLCTANPKWRIDCVIDEVANQSFLSPRTVEAIISHEGIYNESYTKTERIDKDQLKMF